MFTPLLLAGLLTTAIPPFQRAVPLPAGSDASSIYVDAQRAVLESRGQLTLIPRQGPVRSIPTKVTPEETNSSQFRGTQVLPSGEVQSLRLDFRACEAQLWRSSAGRPVARLQGDFKEALSCGRETEYAFTPHFSPNGRSLATADARGLRLWNTKDGTLIWQQPGSFSNVMHRPDGTHLVAVANTAKGLQLELWRSDLKGRISALRVPRTCLRAMTPGIDVDHEQVAFACQGEVRVWNWRESKVYELKRKDAGVEMDVAPVLFGHYVALNEHDRGAALWDIRSGQRLVQTQVPAGVQVTDVAFALGGFLAVALSDGTVQTYDPEKQGKFLRTEQVFRAAGKDQYLTLAFSGAWGQMLVVSGTQAQVIELPRG
ncbi:WD40 repeat domain-containing protein [Deinococcus hopiensis]|uniref:WD40 repeat n=1 Tax=Deinococcus hopiensis KR-140 TaxID=695939 RepID=A0A1W1UVF5_9DEIO|nr:hypothetical protein [Deinococcus hopiensis]SMB85148.1 hypothetical protein SAMN00790413_03284 [Deinococcus hopiensis KR-140]